VTERVHLTEQLAHRALHDTLTDLPNRQLFETTLRQALSRTRRDNTLVALCFIDLDGFKGINDTYGHSVGDDLIVSVANRIRMAIRDGDLAARVGGDEFVVVLDNVSGPAQALAAATRLRDTLIQNRVGEPGTRCGASIGLAVSRPDDTVSSLLNRADAAMYRAKAHHNSMIEMAIEDGFVSATIA
jgi:diguanylate cyclase (GGDEF)-like protein